MRLYTLFSNSANAVARAFVPAAEQKAAGCYEAIAGFSRAGGKFLNT